ncbi:glycosyltransferase family 2 protein [Beijerinckia sp. L45]|uniref:glycosyltransferase family 2 protein n=1 Tax=Beijerinckia sp. L45 TaxID=1641855 RepID=UPI00131CABB3|nr:glycosyltransferase [Beijerinckia sp. L45]
MTAELRVAVAIATTGRAAILTETLRELERQTVKPVLVAICPADAVDVDKNALAALDLTIEFTTGSKGASAQRNALLRIMPAVDVVLFLDDDFFLAPDYIAELSKLFVSDPTIVLATGTLIADGVHGPGFDADAARTMIAAAKRNETARVEDIFNGYGCNMAVRWSAVAAHDLRFDENLPLYSWAEDVEYSRQIAAFGRIVKSNRLVGVHLGTKRGRTSGVRFGYSQVANQAYLRRKGVISTRLALLYCGRNVLANIIGTIRSEAYIDRRGRLLGNYYGVVDLLRGRSSPGRILDL